MNCVLHFITLRLLNCAQKEPFKIGDVAEGGEQVMLMGTHASTNLIGIRCDHRPRDSWPLSIHKPQ